MTERERLIENLDGADVFLRNRANANSDTLNEYDKEILLDIAKTADEAARMLERAIVPPCKVGDTVYFLLEDNFPVHKWYISEETVTEVCSKGIFTSGYYPPRDDLGSYSSYDLFGKEIFLTKEAAEAEQALRQRKEDGK